jgi:DNA-binding IclR family transcriptional regulator
VNEKSVKPSKESMRQVEAVAKALSILECFTSEHPELTLKQLSELTGLHKSRILRLGGTLMAGGFLIRMPQSSYKLGPKLMVLGKVYERTNPLMAVARPILRELSDLTGESASLFVIEGNKRLCLVSEKGPSPLHFAIDEGESLELYAGAGGKLLLAYSLAEFRQQILENTLKRLTPSTIVERDRLEEEYETIRRQGYATSKGERISEAAAMAAPVFDHEDRVCATITVAGPVQRFTAARQQVMCKSLLASAQKLSVLLGQREGVKEGTRR